MEARSIIKIRIIERVKTKTHTAFYPSPFTFSLETPINTGIVGVKGGCQGFTTLHLLSLVVVSHSSLMPLGTVSCAMFLQYFCCSNMIFFNNSFIIKRLFACKDMVFTETSKKNCDFVHSE